MRTSKENQLQEFIIKFEGGKCVSVCTVCVHTCACAHPYMRKS